MTLSRDFFDWQSRQVFDPERDGYSGQINDRLSGANSFGSDAYSKAIYHWEWFGVSGNVGTPIANSAWTQLFPPGTADYVQTWYPVSWRDKVRQVNGGVLTDAGLGIRLPWSGTYKVSVLITHQTNPAFGGVLTFSSAGFWYSAGGGSFSGIGRSYSQAFGLTTVTAQAWSFAAGGEMWRPAWYGASVGSNGGFRINTVYIEVECLRQSGD